MIKNLLLLLFLPIVLFASTQKISVQLDWKHQFEFAGLYAAKSQGYYKDIGLEVELREFKVNDNVVDEVLQNHSDFGISSSSLILDKLQNRPVVLIASYFKQNALALITSKDIKSLKDLKNKKVMATKKELKQTSLSVMLKENGLNREDFTLIEQDFSVEKFISGEIDAMSIFITNQPYFLDKYNVEYNIFSPSDYGIYSYDSELFTSQEYAKAHPILVKEFAEATRKGWEYAFAHKEEIITLIRKKYSSKKSINALRYEAEQTQKLFKVDTFKIGSVVPELIELNTVIYEKLGLVNKSVSIKKLLNDYVFHNEYRYKSLHNSISFTQEEQAFIREGRVLKIANETSWAPFDFNEFGKAKGMSIDYVKLLFEKAGLKYEMINGYTWNDILILFKSDKIDVVPAIYKSKSREEFALFTSAYYQGDIIAYTLKANKKINSLQDLADKTVGVEKSDATIPIIKKYLKNSKIIEYSSVSELLKLLQENKFDAIVCNPIVLKHYSQEKANLSLKNLGDISMSDKERHDISLHIAVRDELKILHSILQKMIDSLSDSEIRELDKKWLRDSEPSESILNAEEREYLDKKVVTMCVDPDWMPFEKLENTQHIGMSADYFKIINKNLQTDIELVQTSSWSESVRKAKNRECDLFSLAMQTPEREKYMNFTPAYLSIPLVLATNLDVPFVADFKTIEGKKLGITKGYAFYEILKKRYPYLNIVEVQNLTDGLNRVKSGELFGYVGTLASVAYIFQEKFIGELKVAGKFDESWNLGIAVRNDDAILLSIMQKAVNSIGENDKRTILNKWIAINYEERVDYTLAWQILSLFTLIIIGVLFWSRKLSLLNKQLEIAKLKAEEATKAKASFLANMSHEIRTPMNSIIGMSYLIKETRLNKVQFDYIQKIETASNNLLSLINNILDFSKMEIKKLELKNSDFNLLQTLNDVENILKIKTYEKGLNLQIIYNKSDNFHLYGDSLRLSQILINLISNAIKFTQKGKIKVMVDKQEKNIFRFSVSDTGIGLTDEQMKTVFSSFTQADSSITRKYGGTGLGLAISKELVELMSGKIWVESIYGEGSKFIFEIPIENSTNKLFETEIQEELDADNLEKEKTLIDKEKLEELFKELREATKKRRPQLCEPILKELNSYALQKEDKKLFKAVQNLILKYKFEDARRILDEK